MEVLACGHCTRDWFVSMAISFAVPPDAAPLYAAPLYAAPIEYYLVRIHSTGAAEGLLDAFLARPGRDQVRYALIAASAFEDGPGLCTVTRRNQYKGIESPALIAQIVGATNGTLGEDSTFYEDL